MKVIKKIAAVGAGTGLFAASLVAVPFGGGSVSAESLGGDSNSAMSVQTELNCTTHTLTTKVMNKTDDELKPDVTFNGTEPAVLINDKIPPGETGYYDYNYSGNNMPVQVKVDAGSKGTIQLDPSLNCSEPVTFMVTQASESAVGGMLTNNSSLVAQVAITQAMGGEERIENLAPGETRFVAMPFNGFPDQVLAHVTIGTTTGFQSTYTVNLNQPTPIPLPTPVEN